MITNYPEKVKKKHQGGFLLSPSHIGGVGATMNMSVSPPAKKIVLSPSRWAKKKLGGRIFLSLLSGGR